MKKANVIVLAGQSNAVGVGHAGYLTEHFPEEKVAEWRRGFDNIKLNHFSHNFKSGRFINTATGCAELGRDTFGPEVGIADLLSEKYPGEVFYIVKCAFGGMSLYRDWLSPSGGSGYDAGSLYSNREQPDGSVRPGWCYNELVLLLKSSLGILEADGFEPEICAFMWMQGESDTDSLEHINRYSKLYDALISDLKASFVGYFDSCVYVDAGISRIWDNYRLLNDAKRSYAEQSSDRRFIDTIGAGLTTEKEPAGNPDIAHYDSDSLIKLGRLFAEYAF